MLVENSTLIALGFFLAIVAVVAIVFGRRFRTDVGDRGMRLIIEDIPKEGQNDQPGQESM